MDPVALQLEHFRRDRQKLLEFIISSNLITEVRSPSVEPASTSAADLDSLSADYVLRCVNSGGVLDISEGSEEFYLESAYPIMAYSQSKASYYTLSDPKRSGSPPRREPPSVDVRHIHKPQSSGKEEENLQESTSMAKSSNGAKHASQRCVKPVINVPSLGLPPLKTGMSDDDLRESAYEILLASMVFSGIEVLPHQDKMKERSSKLLSGLKSKKDRDKVLPQSDSQQRTFSLIDSIRLQMQVSEAMDLWIRKKLMRSISRLSGGPLSLLQIILALMNSTSKSNFHSEKAYIQWNIRQANILEELLCSPTNCSTVEHATIKYSIEKIRHAREWDEMSPSERAEILASIRNAASKVFSLPAKGQSKIGGQTSNEAAGYHLKIRLYENLLYVVFDILDEAQLITEADDVLKHIKLTWSTLGITETIHDALFGWVLFKQFVQTDEDTLLEYATHQLLNVLAAEPSDKKERQYQVSLECNGRSIRSSLVPAIFLSITLWCDGTLLDYHLHFRQKPSEFRRLVNFSVAIGVFLPNKHGEITKSGTSDIMVRQRVKTYIKRSVQAAYSRVADDMDLKYKLENMHPLVFLADNLKMIIRKEVEVFCPVMLQWYPEAGKISSTLLHQVFGDRLKLFLQGISSLSEDAKLILSTAYMLDQELAKLYMLEGEGNDATQPLNHVLDHYNVGEVSGPLILDWVISQHTHILDWISRAFNLEDWEPLSSQQKLALSVVEVFRMIEETSAQFFGLNLPVNITHLQALLSVTFHSLDAYLTKVVNQLVEKNRFYPPVPSLTCYEETMVPVVRKKLVEPTNLDVEVADVLNDLTLSKLCIRLNTVNYIKNQVGLLQDGIRKSWGLVKPAVKRRWFNIEEEEPPEVLERTMSTNDESIEELLETTFALSPTMEVDSLPNGNSAPTSTASGDSAALSTATSIAASTVSSSKLTQLAESLKLEHQFLRVPFEHYKKTIRANHRFVEKEVSSVISDVASAADIGRDEAVNHLTSLVSRLQGLKRKLEEGNRTENMQAQRCRVRIDHLVSADVENLSMWNNMRLNRILVDYMLRMSYYESAKKLAETGSIQDLVDIDVFYEAKKVIEALENEDVGPALSWCSENKSRLKKAKSKLEFQLRLQEFIELVRADRNMQAIQYARKHLSQWGATHLKEFQRVITAVAFKCNTECATYKLLFEPKQWDCLVEQFKQEFCRLYGMTLEPLLNIYLQAGLSALKTPFCYEDDCPKDDPLSQESFRKLASSLPFSKQHHSKLVCYITKELMDTENPPLVLPNGYVYSKKALEEMASKNNGKITCPRTGQACNYSDLAKAYIS